MIPRNLDLERKKIGEFIGSHGRDPVSREDWLWVQKAAYGADLPEDLKRINMANAGTAQKLESPEEGLGKIKPQLRQAESRIESLSQPTDAISLLQEALRIKQGASQMSIGTSEIFKKAGVGGYGALMQSLASRRNEINTNFANFQNIVTAAFGHYKDKANFALKNYERIKGDYDALVDRIQTLEDEERDYSTYIKKLNAKAKIDRDTYVFEKKHATPSYSLEETGGGYAVFNSKTGELIPLDKSGRRTDRNNNPIAVSNAKDEWLTELENAGIEFTIEKGADFAGGLKTLKFPDFDTGIAAAKVLLGKTDAFYWYKKETGKAILDQYGIDSPEEFAALNDASQTEIINSIYQNENGDKTIELKPKGELDKWLKPYPKEYKDFVYERLSTIPEFDLTSEEEVRGDYGMWLANEMPTTLEKLKRTDEKILKVMGKTGKSEEEVRAMSDEEFAKILYSGTGGVSNEDLAD